MRNDNNKNNYAPKVVDESETVDEFNTSKEDEVMGVLEILPDGFGFLRCKNYLTTEMIYMFLHLKLEDLI